MEEQKVDMYIMTNGKFFESHQISQVREDLLKLDDKKWSLLQAMSFKDPTISIILSLFAGSFGIDRFFVGDTGLGVAKLLTCGGLGIWTIVDWFLIMGVTKQKNMENLRQFMV